VHFFLDLGREEALVGELIGPVADGVAVFFVEFDLFGRAVFLVIGVGDGEAVVAVGGDFEDGRAGFLKGALAGFGEFVEEGIHFPTVHEIPVDIIGLGALGEVILEGGRGRSCLLFLDCSLRFFP